MKLCRFDLASSPGTPRSGIVYEGKVYETDGANPVGVHDWNEARLLSPVGQPPSFRLFHAPPGPADNEQYDFRYLNPGTILGPHGVVAKSESTELSCLPCLGAVVSGSGSAVPIAEADGLILGLTLVNVFHLPTENGLDSLPTWAWDVGTAVGPALTTPDELDDTVEDDTRGQRYGFEIAMTLNGEEVFRTDANELWATFAELMSFASLTCPLRQGDLFAAALQDFPKDIKLVSGDNVRLIANRLGTLVSKLA